MAFSKFTGISLKIPSCFFPSSSEISRFLYRALVDSTHLATVLKSSHPPDVFLDFPDSRRRGAEEIALRGKVGKLHIPVAHFQKKLHRQ